MMRRSILAATLLLLALQQTAFGEVQTKGPENFPGKHELSPYVGWQAGFGGGVHGSPSGFEVALDYGYRFHPIVWFVLRVGNVFGIGGSDGFCANSFLAYCYRGGWDVQFSGGVKLKFALKQ